MAAHFLLIERKWAVRSRGITSKALPVAFERKGNTIDDAHRGKQAPTAQQAGLSGRKPDVFHGQQAVIMKNLPVNHLCGLPSRTCTAANSILAHIFQRFCASSSSAYNAPSGVSSCLK